jgi:hypothetical protein
MRRFSRGEIQARVFRNARGIFTNHDNLLAHANCATRSEEAQSASKQAHTRKKRHQWTERTSPTRKMPSPAFPTTSWNVTFSDLNIFPIPQISRGFRL